MIGVFVFLAPSVLYVTLDANALLGYMNVVVAVLCWGTLHVSHGRVHDCTSSGRNTDRLNQHFDLCPIWRTFLDSFLIHHTITLGRKKKSCELLNLMINKTFKWQSLAAAEQDQCKWREKGDGSVRKCDLD